MSIEQIIEQVIVKVLEEKLAPIVEQASRQEQQKPLLEIEEAMEILGVGRSRMYELVKTDGFPAFREGKRWVIVTHLFYRWMDERALESK